jgi:ribosome maturation factor RimP
VLEVSSPGMDNPLKVLRQYKRRLGREVIVVKTDGERVEGIMKAADENGITIEENLKSKKKIVETITLEIPFTEIKSTKLKLNF